MPRLVENIAWFAEQNLNENFRDIAKQIIKMIEEKSSLTITQVAKKANTTAPSVSRFCLKLGFKGYKELLQNLQSELHDKKGDSVKNYNWQKNINFWKANVAIEKNISLINDQNFEEIVRLGNKIMNSQKIFIVKNSKVAGALTFLENTLITMGYNVTMIDFLMYLNTDWQKQFLNQAVTIIIPTFGIVNLFADNAWLEIIKSYPDHYFLLADNKKNYPFEDITVNIVMGNLEYMMDDQADLDLYAHYVFLQVANYLQSFLK